MSLVALLTVTDVRPITPHMLRIGFTGPGLSGVDTWPDQQLKLCFPREGQSAPRMPSDDPQDLMRWYQAFLAIPEDERPWMRSFTVRRLSGDHLDVDFVLHGDNGPASRWALKAKPGDVLARYGPSEDYARPLGTADWYLFAGDETALPAMGTLLESLPPDARAVVFAEVADAAEQQPLTSPADVIVQWLHRSEGASVVDAVRHAEFPPGSAFAWLAGEAGAVRALRRHLVDDCGMAKNRIEFAGYWRRSLTQDDAPTAEDLAEAQERLTDLK